MSDKPDYTADYRNFQGGMDAITQPWLIRDDQYPMLEDGYTWKGGFVKNSGYSAALSQVGVANRGLSIKRLYDHVSGNFTVAQFADGGLYRMSGARAVKIGSGWGATNKLTYTTANRKTYFTNGAQQIKVWTGDRTTYQAAPAATPAEIPTFIFFHQETNRVFAGRGATTKQRNWYSENNGFETWPGNNFFDIPESRTGDSVMGYASLLGRLVIFGQRTISVLYGKTPSDYMLRTLEWDHGCHFPHSIISYSNHILYLGAEGIYAFDGSGPAKLISNPVDSIIDDINKSSEWGPAAYMTKDFHYILSYKSLTKNTGNSVLHNDRELRLQAPSPESPRWTFENVNKRGFSGYAPYNGDTDVGQVYTVAGDTVGQIYKLDSSQQYNGNGIDMDVTTKMYDFKQPFTMKCFLDVTVQAQAVGDYPIELYYKIDGEPSWNQLDSILLSTMGPVAGSRDMSTTRRFMVNETREINRNGHYIQFRIRQNGAKGVNQPVTVSGIECTAKRLEVR